MYRLTWWQQVRYQAGLTLIGLFVLIPLWGIIYLAFDGGVKGWPTTFRVWPEQFTMDVFVRMWEKPAQGMPFLALLRNSLIVSAGAALLSVALGASMAYAFARYRFPGRRLGLFGLLLGVLLPPVALMVPLYLLLSALGIRTTLFGLTLVYTSFAMPFCIWNMRAPFQAVALELEESAFLDGASPWVTFWRITLPLALPAIAVAGLIAFLIGYSEFAMGWLFVDKAQNVTLAMAISGMVQSSYLDSWANLAALALMMSLPVVVIFLAAQRYLINRLLLGPVES
ncbi:MAG: carbohydrate ABC transporter permease [Anaerolineae bacterium]